MRIASAANAFSEIVLQLLGLFTIGGIAHFGDEAGYGRVWDWECGDLPQVTGVFYAGAFLYMVMGVLGWCPS